MYLSKPSMSSASCHNWILFFSILRHHLEPVREFGHLRSHGLRSRRFVDRTTDLDLVPPVTARLFIIDIGKYQFVNLPNVRLVHWTIVLGKVIKIVKCVCQVLSFGLVFQ